MRILVLHEQPKIFEIVPIEFAGECFFPRRLQFYVIVRFCHGFHYNKTKAAPVRRRPKLGQIGYRNRLSE